MHFASFADVRQLDPAVTSEALGGSILALLMAGLVDYDDRGQIVPDLASRYEIQNEGTSYVFFLREGALFHDGSEVRAEDIQRSVERALHPSTPNPFGSSFQNLVGYNDFVHGSSSHLQGVRVEGRYVVRFDLDQKDATFLHLLAQYNLRPVCRNATDRYVPSWLPCGAGPFRLAPGGWERGRSLRLTKHEGYFRPGLPYLDGVHWTFGMAPTVQRFRFEAGDLDAVGELGTGDMALFQRDPRWASLGSFDAEKEVWGEAMNTEVPPFDNVEVRRAVASVIDRSKYARLRPGTVRPLRQLLPPAVPMFEPDFEGQPTNLAEALEHMKKAGFPFDPATGRGGYPHEIPYYAHAQSFGETTGQILAQELAQIGLRLKIRIVSYPTYLALTRRRHQVPMSAQGWQQDYPDPSDFFDSMFHSKAIADEDSNNVSFYSNPKLDSLLDAAKKTLDSTKRAPLYAEANRILRDDAPWAFTHAVRRFEVHQPRLRQYGHHPVWTHFVLRSFLDPGVLPTASRHAWERLTRPSPPSHGLALRAGEPR